MRNFKIATYNVNSIRSRLHIVIPWLEENRPDVFCMQETKVDNDNFPLGEFLDISYHVTYRGEKQYNGVAVASLEKPAKVRFGFDDADPADEDRLIRGIFSGIPILNTYIPQGRDREDPNFAYKIHWFKRFRNLLDKSYAAKNPLIWCGDLNVAPEAIDVYDPKRLLGHVCYNPEVWDAFSLVKSWGLSDIFRKHHPEEANQYTFFNYRIPRSVERGLGWRVDHILATPSMAERSVNCKIDIKPRLTAKPSDHTILVAEFTIQ